MADTIRQQAVAAVFAMLQTIKKEGGTFQTDLGLHGFRWKTTDFSEEETPGFTLTDGPCKFSETGPMGAHDWDCELAVIVCLRAGEDTPDELHRAESDVMKCIGGNHYLADVFGQGRLVILPIDTEFIVKQDAKIISGVKLRFNLHYRTVQWDPYTIK